jgi:hypothetical protein
MEQKESDFIEYLMRNAEDSALNFYKFLHLRFRVNEMYTPIGKSQELPEHFKIDSNYKALIKYENYDDCLYFLAVFIKN